MIDSRNSGKAAERRVAKDMKGIRVGILGDDDVRCPENYKGIGISFETKTRKTLPKQLKQWYKQAVRNIYKNNIPVLVLKEKPTEWKDALVILSYEHFLRYMVYFYIEEEK